MVKDETFGGWIIVSRTKSPVYTLVNPVHIENIYSSGNETVVCLTSGKKLVDKRPIDRFLKAEGGGKPHPAVAYFGKCLREVEERYKAKEEKAKPKPKKIECRVVVDSYAGTAQGSLPIDIGFKIINRDQITITTVGGRIELGRGSSAASPISNSPVGQIYAEYDNTNGVSGYIGSDGAYSLVCKNSAIGLVVIHFEEIKK